MQTIPLQTLRKRSDFLRLNGGRRWAAPGLVLQMKPTPEGGAAIRFGMTVTKKIGNAVTRNRVRRRFRALAHELLPLAGRAGHDYVLIARAGCLTRSYADLRKDLEVALSRVHREKPAGSTANKRQG